MKNETLEMMLNVIVAGSDKHLREFPKQFNSKEKK